MPRSFFVCPFAFICHFDRKRGLEKDIDKNKEICYTYDDNGNILTKSVNGKTIDYRYEEGTDRLSSFGEEQFVYDGMGNPTTYRGWNCEWKKRQTARKSVRRN